jgi:Transposase, Mutator family
VTETVADMGSLENTIKMAASPAEVERAAIRELVVAARARGEDLTGPDGLLKVLTKTVLETALEEELAEHLSIRWAMTSTARAGRNGANSRNGKRTKTIVTDAVGLVQIEVARDRDGTFAPVIVAKRQRRLSEVDLTAESAVRTAHRWLTVEPPQNSELRRGRHVGSGLVPRVQVRTGHVRRMDDFIDGRDSFAIVTREVDATSALLREGNLTGPIRSALLVALAELCQLAGWVLDDAGHHEQAPGTTWWGSGPRSPPAIWLSPPNCSPR